MRLTKKVRIPRAMTKRTSIGQYARTAEKSEFREVEAKKASKPLVIYADDVVENLSISTLVERIKSSNHRINSRKRRNRKQSIRYISKGFSTYISNRIKPRIKATQSIRNSR